MQARIFSALLISAGCVTGVSAQNTGSQIGIDDRTGVAYQRVERTVTKPVQETQMVTRQETRYTPRVVTETRPATRTTYFPSTQTVLEPYVANRWNPFVRPSLAYRFVPKTEWRAQTDVVHQTTTRTEYVAETTTRQVPQLVTRMKTERQITHEPVGRLQADPSTQGPMMSPADTELAKRLRPLGSHERVATFASRSNLPRTTTAPRIATSSVMTTPLGTPTRIATRGQMPSDPPRRGAAQSGQPATDLTRQSRSYSSPLPLYR